MLFRNVRRPFSKGSSGDFLVKALVARGIEYHCLASREVSHTRLRRKTIVAFKVNGAPYYFDGVCLRVADPLGNRVPGPIIDYQAAQFVKRRDVVKSYLRDHGFSVPRGAVFSSHAVHEAESFFTTLASSSLGGICVKSADGKDQRRLQTEICDLSAFRTAFAAVGEHHERVLIEETVPGAVYRFLCLGGRVIAIGMKRPANVEGDGIHTIVELVALKQAERSLNPIYAKHVLKLGRRERAFLKQAGLSRNHVPGAGKLVFLDESLDLHQGGERVDATDSVHLSYVELVERAIEQVEGLVFCSLDVAIQDPRLSATSDNYCFLELSCGPQLSTHHCPWRGQSRDVAGALIDYLASPSWPKRRTLWNAEDLQAATRGEWLTPPGRQWLATGIHYVRNLVRQGDIAIATDSTSWRERQHITDSLDHFFDRGAACAVVSRRPSSLPPNKPVLFVGNTFNALIDIARAARARLKDIRLAAITGSTGKTTTKEFARYLLSLQGPTFGSKANFNHAYGMPLMLAQTPVRTRFGVYECSVAYPLNATLTKGKLLRPHVVVITGIHPDHLEFFDSLETLSDQKCLLFDALEPNGIAVLNRDDSFFRRQLDNARSKGVANILTFGRAQESEFRLLEADLTSEGSHAIVSVFGERMQFDVPFPGEYMLMNCLAALATVHALGGDWRKAIAEISTLPQLRRRNERYLLTLDGGTAELIDDSFSANPASVKTGLSLLKLMNPPSGGRRIAVLGEMKELGAESQKLHAELAPAVKEASVDVLFTIGADMIALREALGPGLPGLHSDDPNSVTKAVGDTLRPGDIVWVKGSARTPAGMKGIIDSILAKAKSSSSVARKDRDLK